MKFSVIIPVYNVAPYLRECLSSVVKATEQLEKIVGVGQWNVEIVCVDDGSTDGSGEILDESRKQLEGVVGVGQRTGEIPLSNSNYSLQLSVIHQPNRGEGGARNAALEVATGEWICFLDSDDLFTPDMLAAGAKLIRENPECDIVRVGAATFKDNEDPRQSKPFRGGLLSGVFCTGFYRRSKFGDVRFTDFLVGADRVYAATCVFQTGRIAESKTIGYLYRQRATSISHVAMTSRKALDGFLHVAEMLQIAAANGRTFATGFRRALVAQVLESGAANCHLLGASERREVQARWCDCVEDLRKNGLLTRWGRFVATVLRLLPKKPVIWIFCLLPYRLKRCGIHR